MIQTAYRAVVWLVFVVTMTAFMHFIRPYTDAAASWLGLWTFALCFGLPAVLLFIGKRYERPADAPPSRLDWLLKRRN